jgi:ferredoxin-NADP reductase
MPPYKVSLQACKTLCSGTTAFYFTKPDAFELEAGQFVNFTLLSPANLDLEGNTRTLSIASAPHEQQLMVAMRSRSTVFKRTLHSLPVGTELLLQGPYGSMTLPRNTWRPAILLAGGIGITPFRSQIWNAAQSQLPREIRLFYSVRVPEEAAFLKGLQEMERYNKRYKLICTVTQREKSETPWPGETGRISIQMFSKWIPDLTVPIYYIAGPPRMVTGVRQLLLNSGVGDENIRAEEFSGYE